MTKLILILLRKTLIGLCVVAIIMFAILKLFRYISELWGEGYGLLFFILISVIIEVLSNKLYKKRMSEVNNESKNEQRKN